MVKDPGQVLLHIQLIALGDHFPQGTIDSTQKLVAGDAGRHLQVQFIAVDMASAAFQHIAILQKFQRNQDLIFSSG